MFKPARMTRVLMGGHKGHMEGVIDVLHQEKAVHLEDYRDPTGTTSIGTPLAHGDAASTLLVRTRALLKALDADSIKVKAIATDDPTLVIKEAEAELSPVIEEAAGLHNDLMALENEASILRPFADLDVDLGVLSGLRSVRGYMGTIRDDPSDAFSEAGIPFDADVAGNHIIAAVPKAMAEKADRILGEHGYTQSQMPEGASGTPAQRLEAIAGEVLRTQERLDRAEARLQSYSETWGTRLASLERSLNETVTKTQAPLHMGTTATTFHIEGWIPKNKANRVQNAISARFGDSVYFEDLGDGAAADGHDDHHGGHSHDASDEPPVKLDNKGLAKPYEFLLGLLGRPRYNEFDPTKLMLLFFPLFFGLMVGDVVVGLAIVFFGIYLKKNNIFGIGGPAVGRALVMGGVLAMFCGLVVFGEGLGIHFVVDDAALDDGELSWEAIIYGTETVDNHTVLAGHFPTEGFIFRDSHEVHAAADDQAIHPPEGNPSGDGNESTNGTLTVQAEGEEAHGSPFTIKPHGTTHLSVNGWFNLGYYSKIHDIVALLMWSIAIALVHLVLGLLIGFSNIWKSHGLTLAIQEKASWLGILAAVGLIAFGMMGGPGWLLWGGVGLLVFSAALLWMGVQHTVGVGFIAILEIPSLFGNILSYTRLAAIGASKAGMAIAFSAIGAILGGGTLTPVWWIVYIIGMVVITLLAILSGGLQSLRLQFVEFFQKFYEGGGRPYVPFGSRRP